MATSSKEIQLRELKDTIAELNALIKTLQETISSQNAREAALQTERDNLKEQVDYLTKKLFGKSSERSNVFPGQYNLFNEFEYEAAQDDEDADQDEPETDPPKKRKPRKTNKERFAGLKVKIEYLDPPEEAMTCSGCGTPLAYIGEEVVREEFHIVPARGYVIKYISRNYGCPNDDCPNKLGNAEGHVLPYIVKGKDGKPHMLHGMASSATVAWILYQKYVNSIPLHRLEKEWNLLGVSVTRATMSRWVIGNAEEYFRPLYDYLHRVLKTRPFLMADETPLQVLKEPERRPQTKSFMWLFRTGERDDIPIVLYKYSETRAGDNAKDFLDNYEGYIMCDGYSGYNKLTKAKRTACWAHVRRYLIDAIPKGKQHDHSQPAVQGLLYVEKLYRIERSIKGLNNEEAIRLARLKEAPDIIKGFFEWADAQRPVKGSRFYKAIVYIQNRRPYMATYLENGNCSFDNNASERDIKDFVIGRKNWLFCDTPKGARASAEIYSLVNTAKANGVNPYYYLRYLLDVLPTMDPGNDEELEKVVPWNPNLKAVVKELEDKEPM